MKVRIKTDKDKQTADSLMSASNRKKDFADEQEKIGKGAIKAGNGSKTILLDLKGTTSPNAYERLKIANKLREEATKDSLSAEKLYKKK